MLYSKEATRIDKSVTPLLADYYYDKTCVVCGDNFKSSRPKGKYCSQRCSNDAYIAWRSRQRAERRADSLVCVICDAPIAQGDGKIKAYCSKACKQKAYRMRKSSNTDSKLKPV